MRGVRNVDFSLGELLGGSGDGVSLVEELEVTLSAFEVMINPMGFCEDLGTGDDGLILPVVSDGLLLAVSEGVALVSDSVLKLGELEFSVPFVQLTNTAVTVAVLTVVVFVTIQSRRVLSDPLHCTTFPLGW